MGKWESENATGENANNWRGGMEKYYGKNWIKQRQKALERDNHKCQICYKTKKELGREPDVHHIKPFKEFGLENYKEANKLDNLVSLCPNCHTKVEWGVNN